MAKNKNNNIDLAMDNLSGFFQVGASEKRKNIPTGHFSLDFGLNFGHLPSDSMDLSTIKGYDPKVPLGLPMGRLCEVFGAEGSGKSSLAYRVCGNAQKMGYNAVWLDAEASFEEELARLNGVDVDNLIYSKCMALDDPDKEIWAENILDNIVAILKTADKNNIGVLVLDSVASLTPKDVGEASVEKQGMAQLARVLSKSVPKICQYAAKKGVLVIFINQVREAVGQMFGDPEKSSGGRVIKFMASVRLKVNKRSTDDSLVWREGESGKEEDRRVVGRISGISVVKNRCSKPLLTNKGKSIILDVPIYYEAYFPDADEVLFDEARRLKLITIRTGIFTWKREGGDVKIEGRIPFMKHLVDNSLLEEFSDAVKETITKNGTIAPPEIETIDFKAIKKKFASQIKEKVFKEEDAEPEEKHIDFMTSSDIDLDDIDEPEVKLKLEKKGKKK